jgi:DNA-binding XRE family transcriptional regulator
MRTVVFTHAAAKQLDAIEPVARESINTALASYAIDGRGDVKRLTGRNGYRLTIGRYRVMFTKTRPRFSRLISASAIPQHIRGIERMSAPEIITTSDGRELVGLPRAEYDALVNAAGEAAEMAADVAVFDAAMADLESGRDEVLPAEVSGYILRGDRLLRALRKWRGISQTQLAEQIGLEQGSLADIERGRRNATPETLAAIARALKIDAAWVT